jgi:hypothetical protein
MGVVQAADGSRLPLETLAALGIVCEVVGKDLDRNRPAQARIGDSIDFAHPARAQQRHHFVRANALPRCERHVRSEQPARPRGSVEIDHFAKR